MNGEPLPGHMVDTMGTNSEGPGLSRGESYLLPIEIHDSEGQGNGIANTSFDVPDSHGRANGIENGHGAASNGNVTFDFRNENAMNVPAPFLYEQQPPEEVPSVPDQQMNVPEVVPEIPEPDYDDEAVRINLNQVTCTMLMQLQKQYNKYYYYY